MRGWLEAFDAHPRIGDLEGLRKKYGAFSDLSRSEQAGASSASPKVLQVGSNLPQRCAGSAAAECVHACITNSLAGHQRQRMHAWSPAVQHAVPLAADACKRLCRSWR